MFFTAHAKNQYAVQTYIQSSHLRQIGSKAWKILGFPIFVIFLRLKT